VKRVRQLKGCTGDDRKSNHPQQFRSRKDGSAKEQEVQVRGPVPASKGEKAQRQGKRGKNVNKGGGRVRENLNSNWGEATLPIWGQEMEGKKRATGRRPTIVDATRGKRRESIKSGERERSKRLTWKRGREFRGTGKKSV